MSQPSVTPFLWFNNNAEEAAAFYVSVFTKAGRAAKKGNPSPMSVEVELDGQRIIAFNGGPMFQFNEAFSLSVACETQGEIDFFWDALSEAGAPGRCGWLKDRFGLSWQIVPRRLGELLRGQKAVSAMMAMGKLDIAALEEANTEAR